jgi:hypothetical protein
MRLFFCKVPRTVAPLLWPALTAVSSLPAQSTHSSGGARGQPVGARPLALAGLDVALADPEAVAANPALLLAARGLATSVQQQRRGGTAGSAAMVSAVGPVTFGLVARHASPGDPGPAMGRPAWYGDPIGDPAAEVPTTAVTLGAARTVRGQRLGIGLTYATDRHGAEGRDSRDRPQGMALELGYQKPLGFGTLGVSVTSLDLSGHSVGGRDGDRRRESMAGAMDGERAYDDTDDWSATRLAAGWFGSKAIAAAWDLGGGVQANLFGDGRVQPLGALEVVWVPIQGVAVALRGGVRAPRDAAEGIATGGAGFTLDHLALDYALAPGRDGFGIAHRVGVRIK